MRLIIGLGNPGRNYRYSRHNIGFLIIDRLAEDFGIKIKLDAKAKSYIGKGTIAGKQVILAKPLWYMNLSGVAVKLLLKRYKLNIQDLLVAFDDLDLEYGKLRIKPSGGSGGHKGVESIRDYLNSSDFVRLRLGIGRRKRKSEVSNYVLNKWNQRQKRQLNEYLERASACCKAWVACGIDKAMNEFN